MDDQQSANRYDAADTENVTSIMDNQQPVPLSEEANINSDYQQNFPGMALSNNRVLNANSIIYNFRYLFNTIIFRRTSSCFVRYHSPISES